MIRRISGSWGRGEVYQSIDNTTIRPNVNAVVIDVMLLRPFILICNKENDKRVFGTITELIEEKWLTHDMAAEVLIIVEDFAKTLISRKKAFKEVRNCLSKKVHNAYTG